MKERAVGARPTTNANERPERGSALRSSAGPHARDLSRARWLRASIALVACVLLPAASRLGGAATLEWSMYSLANEFCIDLLTFDANGRVHRRNPTLLALHAGPGAASLLAGSDHWRQGPVMGPLRRHIDDLAAYACAETAAFAVELTLRERLVGGPERATSSHRRCAP